MGAWTSFFLLPNLLTFGLATILSSVWMFSSELCAYELRSCLLKTKLYLIKGGSDLREIYLTFCLAEFWITGDAGEISCHNSYFGAHSVVVLDSEVHGIPGWKRPLGESLDSVGQHIPWRRRLSITFTKAVGEANSRSHHLNMTVWPIMCLTSPFALWFENIVFRPQLQWLNTSVFLTVVNLNSNLLVLCRDYISFII